MPLKMLKLLVDKIRRPLNTKKQSNGSLLYIDQKIYFMKGKKMKIIFQQRMAEWREGYYANIKLG